MAIRFIGGLPGGGKTAFAVSKLIEELRETKRPIVTNMALKLQPWVDGAGKPRAGLLGILRQRFGQTFDAERRIYLLGDQEVKRFFAVRPLVPVEDWRRTKVLRLKPRVGGKEVEPGSEQAAKDGRFSLEKKHPGVCYFIDEAHEFFAAREWARTGKECLSWASQQRRAGDDCWLISQVVENVEKQLRGVSQECWWFVKHSFLRWSIFRHPGIITYSCYAGTPPRPQESCLHSGKIHYNQEDVRSSYDTASGVGVSGSSADIGKRAKGLNIWLVPILFVALMVGLGFGVQYVQGYGLRKARAVMGAAERGSVRRSAPLGPTSAPPAAVARSGVPSNVEDLLRRLDVAERKPAPGPAVPFVGSGNVNGLTVLSLPGGGTIIGTNALWRGPDLELDGVAYHRERKL